jgi:phage-related protein
MRAKLDRIVSLIEEFGPSQVHEPYVKPIRDKLWEMRLKGRDGIARALYVTAKDRRIVVLHAFQKKTRKIPKRAVDTALSRMKEVNQ